jgi:hypothetical protein
MDTSYSSHTPRLVNDMLYTFHSTNKRDSFLPQ